MLHNSKLFQPQKLVITQVLIMMYVHILSDQMQFLASFYFISTDDPMIGCFLRNWKYAKLYSTCCIICNLFYILILWCIVDHYIRYLKCTEFEYFCFDFLERSLLRQEYMHMWMGKTLVNRICLVWVKRQYSLIMLYDPFKRKRDFPPLSKLHTLLMEAWNFAMKFAKKMDVSCFH